MAAKIAHVFKVKGTKSQALEFLAELQETPAHKWIPIDEMKESNRATVTPRQARWIEAQVEKRVKGCTVEFTAAPAPAEPASA